MKIFLRMGSVLSILSLLGCAQPTTNKFDITADDCNRVKPISADMNIDPYYTHYVSYYGIPIVGNEKVEASALTHACHLVDRTMNNRLDYVRVLANSDLRISIYPNGDAIYDLPDAHNLPPSRNGKVLSGVSATIQKPTMLTGEADLMCELDAATGITKRRSTFLHELGHAIQVMAMRELNPTFDQRLQDKYREAMELGLWHETDQIYAASDYHEYWAEGVVIYFNLQARDNPRDALRNFIFTRDALKNYDPGLFELLQEVFGEAPVLSSKCPTSPDFAETLG